MKIERLVSAGAAIALVLGTAASAEAHITTVTYTGTVISGSDLTDVFGAGLNLAGDSYTAVYTVNDSVSAFGSQSATLDHLFGGTHYHNQSPASAIITINGVTVSITGAYSANVWQQMLGPGSSHTELYRSAEDYSDNGVVQSEAYMSNRIASFSDHIISTTDLNAPLSYTIPKGAQGISGLGQLVDYVYNKVSGIYSRDINLNLDPTSITIAPGTIASAVPEPATWALLILGVGMVGVAGRWRRSGRLVSA